MIDELEPIRSSDLVETILGMVPREDLESWELLLHYFEPLKEFYLDEEVTEILVNSYDHIVIEKAGKLYRMEGATFGSEKALQSFIYQVANRLNQDIDDGNPVMDARFPDGSRLCCTFPAVSPRGATISMRCKPRKSYTFDDLVRFGSISQDMVDFIRGRVESADTILISGNTGAGKTSLLRSCAYFIDPRERVITSEDTAELHLLGILPHVLELEAPKRKLSAGETKIELADLVKVMLRMRPDRPIVGEVRDMKAADAVIQLSNTDHTGGATTVHANGPDDAIRRFQYLLAATGNVSYELAEHEVLKSFQLLIHCHRNYKIGRKVTHISRIVNEKIVPIFIYDEEAGRHRRVDGVDASGGQG
ncbi:CpaF family protein [Pseudomonas amygdali]|uniref:CpaF family protein n=1 Tax=Pseudomonas amygdali TaxID=47877 RepID=UPI0006E59E9D|nr:ATPase, T2SS/T4P/T4SS family [Pseudomonas amygdali]KPW69572.1 hypothetical protein ALO78_200086 [Pseudomonas amygdali pv. ciccaronei]